MRPVATSRRCRRGCVSSYAAEIHAKANRCRQGRSLVPLSWHARGMAFTVYLSSDEGISHGYGDKDRYELSAAGTLVVRPADGTETYTYSQWVYLKADTDHTAGGPKSGSGKATFI
ncbi:MAG: hypothetical protein QOC76_4045 [Mycobacterium sp.]|nr:hypothetical protein [Mycobacterium sp.]